MTLSVDEKSKIIKKFHKNENDTGSAEVQIALLTERIKELTEHMKDHKHDFLSKRGLLKLVAKRRIFLKYLHRTNPESYMAVKKQLGLKK